VLRTEGGKRPIQNRGDRGLQEKKHQFYYSHGPGKTKPEQGKEASGEKVGHGGSEERRLLIGPGNEKRSNKDP